MSPLDEEVVHIESVTLVELVAELPSSKIRVSKQSRYEKSLRADKPSKSPGARSRELQVISVPGTSASQRRKLTMTKGRVM